MPHSVDSRADDSNDEQEEAQFRFQDLPGEVRNEICKIVAEYRIERTDSRTYRPSHKTQQWELRDQERLENPKRLRIVNTRYMRPKENPVLMTLQPGLFLACKQTGVEGLPFFYQRHKCAFCLGGIETHEFQKFGPAWFTKWFESIGSLGRRNLRHLEFYDVPSLETLKYHERVHQKLSKEACVTYSIDFGPPPYELWHIANRYHAKNPEKVPVIWTKEGMRSFEELRLSYEQKQLMRFKLIFEPGSGWFGMAPDNKAQIHWRGRKRKSGSAADAEEDREEEFRSLGPGRT